MLVCKEFTFEAAHKLLNYKGKCANLHGHTYKLQITVSGPVKKDGMVMDFTELNKIVETAVLKKLDHSYLNEIIKQPTAENISIWIWDQLKKPLRMYQITLWETPTSYVVFNGDKKL